MSMLSKLLNKKSEIAIYSILKEDDKYFIIKDSSRIYSLIEMSMCAVGRQISKEVVVDVIGGSTESMQIDEELFNKLTTRNNRTLNC